MYKRLSSFIIALFFFLSMLSFSAFADNEHTFDGEVQTVNLTFMGVGVSLTISVCSTCGTYAKYEYFLGVNADYLSTYLGVSGTKYGTYYENPVEAFQYVLLPTGDLKIGDCNAAVTSSSADDTDTPDGYTGSGSTVSPNVARSGYLVYYAYPAAYDDSDPISSGTFASSGNVCSWSDDSFSITNVLNVNASYYVRIDSTYLVKYRWILTAPVAGSYFLVSGEQTQTLSSSYYNGSLNKLTETYMQYSSGFSTQLSAGGTYTVYTSGNIYVRVPSSSTTSVSVYPLYVYCIPTTSTTQKYTQYNIKVDNSTNNTWNGNIYVDNSSNLTYIYPEYTTINNEGDTVTNVSETAIVYNSETNQYITYDQTTNNYYYITYNTTPEATATPSPTPEVTASPTPTSAPSGGDDSDDDSGSGSNWWTKLLDTLLGGLLDAIGAVLKLLLKLVSTVLSWVIWAASQVLTLLPFLPPGLNALIIGGVVVCFVIAIIKFIRG